MGNGFRKIAVRCLGGRWSGDEDKILARLELGKMAANGFPHSALDTVANCCLSYLLTDGKADAYVARAHR